MKIGILTSFWFTEDNYGSVLQSYALSTYLKEKGHDVILIRYVLTKDKKLPFKKRILKYLNVLNLIEYVKNICVSLFMNKKNKKRRFQDFKSKYICYSDNIYYSYEDLERDCPNCDCYIVGSDQVWNFYGVPLVYTKKTVRAFLLDFGNIKAKKIAFAASFGNSELTKDFRTYMNPLLKKIDYISVREKNGNKILKEMGIDSDWVLDPVFLLDKNKYRNLFIKEREKKYIFVYLLSNKSDFSMAKLKKFARKNNLNIIYVTGNQKFDFRKKEYPSIQKWLEYIFNAKYVITNSFHCSAFSILFNVPFLIVPQSRYLNQNDRFESLFEYFELSERYLLNNNYDRIDLKINWNKVNEKIYKNFDFMDSKIISLLGDK